MFAIRSTVAAAVLGLAALASAPANADLILGCSGQTGCTANLMTVSGNTVLSYGPHAFGHFTIGQITALGASDCPGCLLNVLNMDVHSTGSGSFNIFLTETNLTASGVTNFLMAMSGTLTATGTLSDSRNFYLDPTNSGLLTDFLGNDSGSCAHSICSEAGSPSKILSVSGLYSVTEEITLTANGSGSLDSGDTLSAFLVPEPVSLSLFGTGLLGLGAISRRRRKAAKKA